MATSVNSLTYNGVTYTVGDIVSVNTTTFAGSVDGQYTVTLGGATSMQWKIAGLYTGSDATYPVFLQWYSGAGSGASGSGCVKLENLVSGGNSGGSSSSGTQSGATSTLQCTTPNTWSGATLNVSHSLSSDGRSATVTAALHLYRVDGGRSYNANNYADNFYVTIDGETFYFSVPEVSGTTGTTQTASKTIELNVDGTKSIIVACGGAIRETTFSISGVWMFTWSLRTTSPTGTTAIRLILILTWCCGTISRGAGETDQEPAGPLRGLC